jgi:hypothetical protein
VPILALKSRNEKEDKICLCEPLINKMAAYPYLIVKYLFIKTVRNISVNGTMFTEDVDALRRNLRG